MAVPRLESEFMRYLIDRQLTPGDRLPSLAELSAEIGISVGKLREQLEVARTLGLVEASPRRGITRTEYSFLPPVRFSLLTAIELDPTHFQQFSVLRIRLETAFWREAVSTLSAADKQDLRALVESAQEKLSQARIQIPYQEHRQLHLAVFRRLDNPFVLGLLEAYWDAYEAVELNTYADLSYLQEVWDYHSRIVEAIVADEIDEAKRLLIEHYKLLSKRGICIEQNIPEVAFAA